MRLLKFLAIPMVAPCLLGVSSMTQAAHPAQQARAMARPPAQTPQQVPVAKEPAAAMSSAAKGRPSGKNKAIIVPAKPQQAPKSPEDRLLMKGAIRISRESLQKALREAKERESLQPYRLLAGNDSRRDRGPGSFDDGIYFRQVDGATVCGAIVSYNFSSGENPELESVTTCTPTNAVITKRARGKNRMPKRPQVVRIGFQRDEKK